MNQLEKCGKRSFQGYACELAQGHTEPAYCINGRLMFWPLARNQTSLPQEHRIDKGEAFCRDCGRSREWAEIEYCPPHPTEGR